MRDTHSVAWNCLLSWLACLLFLIVFATPADPTTKSGMPYVFLGGMSALTIFGIGYPTSLYTIKWLRRNQRSPHPLAALGLGVTVSQIVLLGILGTYLCLIAQEDGPQILLSLLYSFYDGTQTMFAAAAGIAGGLIGYLTARDSQDSSEV